MSPITKKGLRKHQRSMQSHSISLRFMVLPARPCLWARLAQTALPGRLAINLGWSHSYYLLLLSCSHSQQQCNHHSQSYSNSLLTLSCSSSSNPQFPSCGSQRLCCGCPCATPKAVSSAHAAAIPTAIACCASTFPCVFSLCSHYFMPGHQVTSNAFLSAFLCFPVIPCPFPTVLWTLFMSLDFASANYDLFGFGLITWFWPMPASNDCKSCVL